MDILIIILLLVALVLVIKIFTKVLRVVLILVIIAAALYWSVVKIDEYRSNKLQTPIFAKTKENSNVYKGLGYEIIVDKNDNGVITKSEIKAQNKISDFLINK